MEYRTLEKLNVKTSLLGFGCMRFPTGAEGKIDREISQKMIDAAMAAGVNYYDSAYVYHGGESEVFTGKALKKYDRSSYYLATKLPCWFVKELGDVEKILKIQLERFDTEYIDFYLLHALNKGSWKQMSDMGVYDYCLELKKQGKIKHLGFSFHDDYEGFEQIINAREWDFCQIQLNYMDTEDQAGIKGYELAEKLGVPVIVMEPVKGGSLANFPDEINDELKKINPNASAASWALRWAGTLPGVKVILSGMSTPEQVEDNIKTFGDFKPLNETEFSVIESVKKKLEARVKNNCTGCNYCMPCPAGVNIPYNFNIWNQYGIYENKGSTAWRWKNEIKDQDKAHNCTSCGNCEELCPQKISIRDDLVTLQKELDALL